MENLTKIVHKIANYVSWQNEGLTEDEFRVLDRATGFELAEIAYKNRINFNRFLINADEMINIYNEHIIWTQLKEVKQLKRSLQNTVPFTKQKVDVPRASKRIQQAADRQEILINRVKNVENIPSEIPQIELLEPSVQEPQNIQDEVAQTITEVPNNRTFVASLLGKTDSLSHSIPMHRNIARGTDHITLNQNIDRIEANIQDEDDLPVLNEAEIARLGFFDGDQGRKISKIFHQRDESYSVPLLPSIDNQSAPENLLPLEEVIQPPPIDEQLQSMRLEETPLNKTCDQLDQQMAVLHAEDPPQLPILETSENIPLPENIQHANNVQPASSVLNLNEPQIIQNVDEQSIPQNEQLLQRRESSASLRDSMAERYESFRKAVDAAEALLGKAKRRVRRPQRPQRQDKQTTNDNEFGLLKLRKEVTCKAKKRPRARPVKQPKTINAGSNLFEDIEIHMSHDLPFENGEIQEMEVAPPAEVPPVQNRQSDFALEFDSVTSHHRVLTSTPMSLQNKKRANVSPEAQESSKRIRRLESLDETRDIPVNVPENLPETTEPDLLSIPNLPTSIQESNFLAPIMEIPEPAPNVSLPPLIDIPMPELESMTPSFDIPQLPVPQTSHIPQIINIIETPASDLSKDQSLPKARKTSRQALIQKLHIEPESVDYDRLRRNSKLLKTPVDSRSQILPDEIFQNACENISEREAIRIRNSQLESSIITPMIHEENVPESTANAQLEQEEEIINIPEKKFKNLPRVFMNGEEHLEIISNDGSKKVYYTEHHLSCTTLYLKIRFLMASLKGSNPWIMDIKELFSNLKDWKGTKLETYQQILHMSQEGIFIPKFNDCGDLIEIEHPLNRFEDASDKEN